ncbi:MAG: Single-stranded DNA-binding protein [Frankiales bacterium]|nr:Single-stranded DNA-binding protein [Frankiales bacterium]
MEIATRNEVALVGRLAAPAEDRELPSGDVLTTWRLVVGRPPSKRPLPEGVRPTTIDTLECVAWTSGVQRSAAGWAAGDVLAVEGALRRRFWRAPTGASSRYEVEVTKAKRLAKAA